MPQYILSHMGFGPTLDELLSQLKDAAKVDVVEVIGNSVVVEARSEALQQTMQGVSGWQRSIVKSIPVPDSRVKPNKMSD